LRCATKLFSHARYPVHSVAGAGDLWPQEAAGEIARQIAKYMLQFQRMSNDFKRQLESEMLKIELEEKPAAAKSYQLAAPNQPLNAESQPQTPASS
jgi:Sec-independent protein translocase protein TatA